MSRIISLIIFSLCFGITGLFAQAQDKPDMNTLLWRVSGNGLAKPSYIFGTMHIICKDKAAKIITPTLKQAMQSCNEVLFEVDVTNTAAAIIASLQNSNMLKDTTLKQLVSKRQLKIIMDYFSKNNTSIPLQEVQTLRPLILESQVSKAFLTCADKSEMEQELSDLAQAANIKIGGISSIQEQGSFGDSISYKNQAKSLLRSIELVKKPKENIFYKIEGWYGDQQMISLDSLFTAQKPKESDRILLEARNNLWVSRLTEKMKTEQVFLAVGCAHLFGKTGLATLLRKQGYTVEGVPNNN